MRQLTRLEICMISAFMICAFLFAQNEDFKEDEKKAARLSYAKELAKKDNDIRKARYNCLADRAEYLTGIEGTEK